MFVNESKGVKCPFIDYFSIYDNKNESDNLPVMEATGCVLITGREECDMRCTVYAGYGDDYWRNVGTVDLKNYPKCKHGTTVFNSDSTQDVGTLTCDYTQD